MLLAPRIAPAVLTRQLVPVRLAQVHAVPDWWIEETFCMCHGEQSHNQPTLYEPEVCLDFDEAAREYGEYLHRQEDAYDEHGRRQYCEYGKPFGDWVGCEHPVLTSAAPVESAYRAEGLDHNPGLSEMWEEPFYRDVWQKLLPVLRARRDQVRADPEAILADQASHFYVFPRSTNWRTCRLPEPRSDIGRALEGGYIAYSTADLIADLAGQGHLDKVAVLDMLAELAISHDLSMAAHEGYRAAEGREADRPDSDYARALGDTAEMLYRKGVEARPNGGRSAQYLTFGPIGRTVGGVASDDIRGVWGCTSVHHHHLLDETDAPPFLLSWRRVVMAPADERTTAAVRWWRGEVKREREQLDSFDKRLLEFEEDRHGHGLQLPLAGVADYRDDVIEARKRAKTGKRVAKNAKARAKRKARKRRRPMADYWARSHCWS